MSLPKGFKLVEYIQSSGTQRIDTGYTVNKTDSYTLTLIAEFNNNAYAGANGYMQFTGDIAPSKSEIKIVYDGSTYTETIYVNGTVVSTNDWTTYNGANVKIGLFCLGDPNNAWWTGGEMQVGKIYASTLIKGSTLVRDFISCINDSGSVGLYDVITRVFYGNAGTGAFTAGPEVILDPPSAPSGLQQVLTVGLTWGAVDGATGYRIYRDGKLVGDTETPEFFDYGVDPNSTFVYMVTAYNDGGESPGTSVTVYTKTGYFIYKPYIETANFL